MVPELFFQSGSPGSVLDILALEAWGSLCTYGFQGGSEAARHVLASESLWTTAPKTPF